LLDRWWAHRDLHVQRDGIDVDAVLDGLRARARAARDRWEYARALRDALARFGDGHLRLAQAWERVERRFTSGLSFTTVQEGIALNDSGDRRARGSLLVSIDGQPVDAWLSSPGHPGSTPQHRRAVAIDSLNWQMVLPGETPSWATVTLRDVQGLEQALSINWTEAPPPGPTPNAVQARLLEDGVGLLRLRTFSCRDELAQTSDLEFRRQLLAAGQVVRGCAELIVDVRDNEGGRDEQARMVAAWLVPEPMVWMRYVHQDPYGPRPEEQALLEAPIDRVHSSRPERVWLLVGPRTFSTAEIFAAALRRRPDVRLVGEPTGGGTGNPQLFRLPYSGLGIHIPVTRFLDSGGEVLEGKGLEPDVVAVPRLADVAAGRDAVLDAARRLIAAR
jgi:hypothetical protein